MLQLSLRARQVLGLAQEEARAGGSWSEDGTTLVVRAPHLLVALLAEGEGVAARALDVLAVGGVEYVRGTALGVLGNGRRLDNRVCAVVNDETMAEVMRLAAEPGLVTDVRPGRIGTEHLLLALVDPRVSAFDDRAALARGEDQGPLTIMLGRLGLDDHRIRPLVLAEIRARGPRVWRDLTAAERLLRALVEAGFPSSLTVYSSSEARPGPGMLPQVFSVRVNVAYSKLREAEMNALGLLAAEHGFEFEFSREHGPTFRPVG